MHLHHLSLANFRNYVRLDLRLGSGLTVIRGDNAQGKTNLLEAIYYLSTTRSFRARVDGELVHWLAWREDQPYARLVGSVETASGDLKVELALVGTRRQGDDSDAPPSVRKHVKVNGVTCRALDLVGQFPAVMFGPPDLDLVDGQPSLRRRYLDVALSQVSQRYVRSLARYNRVLQQRNHLLRRIADRERGSDQLAFWDAELAEHGAILVSERLAAVHALNQVLEDLHPRLTGRRERLRVHYQCSFELGGREARYALKPEEVQDRLRNALAGVRREELRRGVSVVGPHRDDLRFVVNDVDMGTYGSRGQQRTVALALKLAEGEFMRQRVGEAPALLLDDVMSELDEARRADLMVMLQNHAQVIVTATSLSDLTPAFLAVAACYEVREGIIHPIP